MKHFPGVNQTRMLSSSWYLALNVLILDFQEATWPRQAAFMLSRQIFLLLEMTLKTFEKPTHNRYLCEYTISSTIPLQAETIKFMRPSHFRRFSFKKISHTINWSLCWKRRIFHKQIYPSAVTIIPRSKLLIHPTSTLFKCAQNFSNAGSFILCIDIWDSDNRLTHFLEKWLYILSYIIY